ASLPPKHEPPSYQGLKDLAESLRAEISVRRLRAIHARLSKHFLPNNNQDPLMDHFTYRNRILHCDDVPVPALAEKYGTPLYLYSTKTLLHHLKQLQIAFIAVSPLFCS